MASELRPLAFPIGVCGDYQRQGEDLTFDRARWLVDWDAGWYGQKLSLPGKSDLKMTSSLMSLFSRTSGKFDMYTDGSKLI